MIYHQNAPAIRANRGKYVGTNAVVKENVGLLITSQVFIRWVDFPRPSCIKVARVDMRRKPLSNQNAPQPHRIVTYGVTNTETNK